nr:F-box/kelch-repeat protein At1g74510-like isoform X3 [Ziziphus jujuba var. spinosa]
MGNKGGGASPEEDGSDDSENMLEGPSYLVSRELPSSCEQESKWIYNTYRVIELSNNKRRLEDGEHFPSAKLCKISDAPEGKEAPADSNELPLVQAAKLCKISDAPEGEEAPADSNELPLVQAAKLCKISDAPEGEEATADSNELPLVQAAKLCKISDAPEGEEAPADSNELPLVQADPSDDQNHAGDYSDVSSLIHQLGRDISINCLLRCSRSDYGSIASLNRSFRSLIRSGELYRLRREMGIIEHWVYFSCSLLEWEAFDPNQRRWMHLPKMNSNDCFMCSDKESLAVGTELLVFGKEITSHVIYKYSILSNTWSSGMKMNTPRCLFGSASLGEIAILAGGCGPSGNILNSAELYNSETGDWVTLPSMNKPRKMCSAVFMHGKFYVIGGIGEGSPKSLTCGEVYDLEKMTWTEIPDMFPGLNGGAGVTEAPAAAEAPPLLAVVNNILYAADYVGKGVMRYNKEENKWDQIGSLPDRAVSMNGWGLAFRACGDRLIVIGGPRALGGGTIELNSWIPDEGPPEWNVLASKQSGSFVYNCAVMGC